MTERPQPDTIYQSRL